MNTFFTILGIVLVFWALSNFLPPMGVAVVGLIWLCIGVIICTSNDAGKTPHTAAQNHTAPSLPPKGNEDRNAHLKFTKILKV